MQNLHEPQPRSREPSEPVQLGDILRDMLDHDTQELPAELPKPVEYIEYNPKLREIAEKDELLANRINALEISREQALSNPKNQLAQAQVIELEDIIREHADANGYNWQPEILEEDTNENPIQP